MRDRARLTSGITATIALALAVAFADTASADWATYQGDAAHTGYVPMTTKMGQASLAWQSAKASSRITGLAVGGDTVFATNSLRFVSAPSFRALDQASGATLWSKQIDDVTSTSAPAYADGKVYFQTDGHSSGSGNYLHAYAARTGGTVFKSSYSAQWETYLHPTPYGGNVYTGGGYFGGMYSFNGTTGGQNWFGSVPQYDGWTPAIDGKYAYSFTGSGSTTPIRGVFRMLNLATGTVSASVEDSVYNWTGYTMNNAVVLGADQKAYNVNGGRLIAWDTALDATHTPHVAWSKQASFAGQVSLAGGRLYAINGGALDVLDASTGDLLWSWSSPGGSLGGAMIVTDDVLFVGNGTTTFALDLASRASVWSYPVAGQMALSDDTLYVGGTDGAVYAFAVVPEPATLGALSVVGVLARRRRR